MLVNIMLILFIGCPSIAYCLPIGLQSGFHQSFQLATSESNSMNQTQKTLYKGTTYYTKPSKKCKTPNYYTRTNNIKQE